MTPIANCEALTASQLVSEIRLRNELLKNMVGSLYPRIVEAEIDELYKLLRKAQ